MVEEVDESNTVAASGRGRWEAAVVVAGPDINRFPVTTQLWMRSATAVASCWMVASGNRGVATGERPQILMKEPPLPNPLPGLLVSLKTMNSWLLSMNAQEGETQQ